MRRPLTLAALALGAAAAFLPVAPASAYCDPLLSGLTGECTNGCVIVGRAYVAADHIAGVLPDDPFVCPA